MKRFLNILALLVLLLCGLAVNAQAAEPVPATEPVSVVIAPETDQDGAEVPIYIIADGTVYYESSDAFGSGRYGVVGNGNMYTTDPCYAWLNGFSYLDEAGNILLSDFINARLNIEIPDAPEGAVALYVHFNSLSYRNGWIEFVQEHVLLNPAVENEGTMGQSNEEDTEDQSPEIIINDGKMSPEEVVEEIVSSVEEEDASTTILLMDVSGSMTDNQEEVINLLGELNLENAVPIVFASYAQKVSWEELREHDFWVDSTSTDLYEGLSKAWYYLASYGSFAAENNKIILISDLENNCPWPESYTDLRIELVIYDPVDNGATDMEILELLKAHYINGRIEYNLMGEE